MIDLTEEEEQATPSQPRDTHAVRRPRTPVPRLNAQRSVSLHNVNRHDLVRSDQYGEAAEMEIHSPGLPQFHRNIPVVLAPPRAPSPDFILDWAQHLGDEDIEQAALQAIVDDQMVCIISISTLIFILTRRSAIPRTRSTLAGQ